MIRHPAVLSFGAILLVMAVWALSPHPLEWLGLSVFDPLDRICLVMLVLSVVEVVHARAR